jgi:hypothetical protein
MMTTTDIDLTLYFRKKHTPPPSVLVVRLPNDKATKDPQRRISPTVELRSRQQKTRPTTLNTNVSPANNSDIHDSSLVAYGWQRHTDKITHIGPAPDVAYRNTYLDETRREKSAVTSTEHGSRSSNSRSPSPRSQHSQQQQLPRVKTAGSSSPHTSNPSPRKQYQQYRTVYDYIRESIKQIERQRNLKQQNFATRIKRPQNDDAVLRRVLGDKKSASASKVSSVSRQNAGNPQNFVNYINHSREQVRVLHTTTPNHLYQQQQQTNQKYNRQRTAISQDQNDSPDKQQSLMMATATVANS